MTPTHVRRDDVELQFLQIGFEYYIAARSSAREALLYVAGVLFHHAIEMFLKARLSRHHSLKELADSPFQHNLNSLWREFKGHFPQEELNKFDDTVEALHRFWRIRYPDMVLMEGVQIYLDWAPTHSTASLGSPPTYRVVVTDVDQLVIKIFEICSRNIDFFVGGRNKYARDALEWSNSEYPGC